MESDSDENLELTPPNILEAAKITSINLLPEKSRKKYEVTYKLFMNWRNDQNVTSYSENVLLAYFGHLSKLYKATTLWTQYSMLRTTLNINKNVDIAKYAKLRAFLKRHSDGYKPKKSKIFTTDDINKFIKEAPDEYYLLTKVALIMGIMGACRRHELHQMKITDLNDLGSAVLVTIPDTKTKIVRKFTITGQFYEILKKYVCLRPSEVQSSSFFLNYQKGKCTIQKVGINKFGAMGKQIAKYLNLPNSELYTGHCFRRSSATILVDTGPEIQKMGLEREGMKGKIWESSGRRSMLKRNGPLSWLATESTSESVDSSAKKLKPAEDIDFTAVFLAISECVKCKKCGSDISFTESANRGLGFNIVVLCAGGCKTEVSSCPYIDDGKNNHGDDADSISRHKQKQDVDYETVPIEKVMIKEEYIDDPVEEILIKEEHTDDYFEEIVVKEGCLEDYPVYSKAYSQLQLQMKTEKDDEEKCHTPDLSS